VMGVTFAYIRLCSRIVGSTQAPGPTDRDRR
jgi:hypothetical protein